MVLPISHCWMERVPHGLHSHGDLFKKESHSAELVGCRSTSNVCGTGIRRLGKAVLQELIHGSFDLRGAPAVIQERPPVCVTDCKSLYDHLLAVGSPTTLQDKRSAVDVLIIRESLKKTGCVIRWAPTGLQLADGLTKDKGEAVECLRRSLRSGS